MNAAVQFMNGAGKSCFSPPPSCPNLWLQQKQSNMVVTKMVSSGDILEAAYEGSLFFLPNSVTEMM